MVTNVVWFVSQIQVSGNFFLTFVILTTSWFILDIKRGGASRNTGNLSAGISTPGAASPVALKVPYGPLL